MKTKQPIDSRSKLCKGDRVMIEGKEFVTVGISIQGNMRFKSDSGERTMIKVEYVDKEVVMVP